MFETERLKIRQLIDSDADELFIVYGDAEAMVYVDDGDPIKYEDCIRWIEVTRRNYAKYGYGMSAIELKSSGELIGFCGLVHPNQQPEAEIKYALKRAYWGQGFATETVAGMLAYGAREFGIERVIATIDPRNDPSRRVLHKVGMTFVKVEPDEDGADVETLEKWLNG